MLSCVVPCCSRCVVVWCDFTLLTLSTTRLVRFFPPRTVFYFAQAFNRDLNAWDVSSVTKMRYSKLSSVASPFCVLCPVVQGVRSFGVISLFSLSLLPVSCVSSPPRTVFGVADRFNGDVSAWDVSSVTNMAFSKLSSVASCFRVLCPVVQGV